MEIPNIFNVVLVGDAASGKTCFVNRHLTGQFIENYVPTCDVQVYSLPFNTNRGRVIFKCWDTRGDGKNSDLFSRADAAFVFINKATTDTNRIKNDNIWKYITEIRKVANIPIVICASKCDVIAAIYPKCFPILSWNITRGFQWFDISSKSNYQYEKPFLSLLKTLTNDPTVGFIAPPVAAQSTH